MHEIAGPALLVWIESSGFAQAMREWLWLYPAIEIAHITGIVLLVGAAAMFDLRLLGMSRALPVSRRITCCRGRRLASRFWSLPAS